MNQEYRPYVCTACGKKKKIKTNHEGDVLDYCENCSWKRDFAGPEKSFSIPQLGNHTYRKFTLDTSVNEMDHMSKKSSEQASRFRNIIKMKECLSPDGKKKMLKLLKYFKQLAKEEYTGNPGGETDIANPDYLLEDAPTPQQNVVAKTFDTRADFDSYIAQSRGIEMTPKEQQSILAYKNAKPTQQDKFFVKYESTDSFGTNNTTVIKKLKEANQFCWTAFSKHERAEDEGKPEEEKPELTEQEPSENEVTVSDQIRITKSITFTNDVEGASILIDFLRKLDI